MTIRYLGIVMSLVLLTTPISALNNCEDLAKEFQQTNGGLVIFMNPIKDNGAFELCRYCGHWMNYINNSYYDTQSNTHLKTIDDVKTWYYWNTGKDVVVWDMSTTRPPFPLARN